MVSKISYTIYKIIPKKINLEVTCNALQPRLHNRYMVLQYSGADENVKETQIAPLPFLGITSEFKINDRYSFYADMHYFKYNTDKLGIHFYDKSMGININLYKKFKLVVGYKKYDLGVSNTGGSSNIIFDINQETPFIGLTVSH